MDLHLKFQWIKTDGNELDPAFISMLRDHYKLNWFVETGTFRGGTASAMSELFDRVDTVELDQTLASDAVEKFSSVPGVTVHQGESVEFLKGVLGKGDPALIWLDAHYSGGETARGAFGNSPLVEEMNVIIDSPSYSSSLILIDDLRYFVSDVDILIEHEAIGGYPIAKDFCETIESKYDFLVFGDVLLLVPKGAMAEQVSPSEFLKAYTVFRCREGNLRDEDILGAEKSELAHLEGIPSYLIDQLNYGLGFHYFAARAKKRQVLGEELEEGDPDLLAWLSRS